MHNKTKHGFWGKYDSRTEAWLPLAAHCLDVGLCFRALTNLPGFNRALVQSTEQELFFCDLDRLAVIALLHDFGKANRGFQRKVFDSKAPRAGHIRELAPIFDPQIRVPELAERFLAALDADAFLRWFDTEESAYSYFMASFSHHGRPLKFEGERTGLTQLAKNWWQPDQDLDPATAIRELVDTARLAFPDAFETGGAPLPSEPRFHHRFAGLVMLADWLGSNAYWFPIEPVRIEDRLYHDRLVIPEMLRSIGLEPGTFPLSDISFEQHFPFSPRPLQALFDQLAPHDPANDLLIAESETGSGKTEAALHWFSRLYSAGLVDSLYFALPTRVAARELYKRVTEAIERWFPDSSTRPVTVLAVPGYAEIDGLPLKRRLPDEGEANRWTDDPDQKQRERQWAAEHPKRFLAAAVAVGTIDQALYSAIQTAHAHLRSVCLDRALLVVDEVHASDTYMTNLLEHLLQHHLGAGGKTLLLSATLGSAARAELLQAAGTTPRTETLDTAIDQPYPALSTADGQRIPAKSNGTEIAKSVTIEPLPMARDPRSVIETIIKVLKRHARILVVLNTVGRANKLFHALEQHAECRSDWLFRANGIAAPHHGRFAGVDRALLDKVLSECLGKNGPPGPLAVVGTQTLEQSLDIDADLLITDLAPADVLLQRIGRLHRHRRHRPPGFGQARCLVLVPDRPMSELLDACGNVVGEYKEIGYGSVYPDLRPLALTLEALAQRSTLSIPQDNRWFVEHATHPERINALRAPKWQRHAQNIEGEILAMKVHSESVLIDFGTPFGEVVFNDAGAKVGTRLGADTRILPLDLPANSPFGNRLEHLPVPGHMLPDNPDETMLVKQVNNNGLILLCGQQRYRYTRFGLEKEAP